MRRASALVIAVTVFYLGLLGVALTVRDAYLTRGDPATWWYYLRSESGSEVRASVPDDEAGRVSASTAEAVPVLAYHGVVDRPDGTNIPLTGFIDQMESLVAAGYQAVGTKQLASFLVGAGGLPPKPIVITFDDARRDQYRDVDLILARLGLRAVMFVPTRRVLDGRPFFLSWEELRRMHRSGRWDIECHGRDAHDPIPTGPDATGDFLANLLWLPEEGRLETLEEFRRRVRADHQACRRDLETHVPGLQVTAYAFPMSNYGQVASNDPRLAVENFAALGESFRLGFYNSDEGFYNYPAPLRRPAAARPPVTLPEATGGVAKGARKAILVRRLHVPGDWTGAELVDRLERADPRRLLLTAGADATAPSKLVLTAAPNEYGAQAMAEGTDAWRDYRVEGVVRRGATRAVYLLARFRDADHYLAAGLDRNTVYLRQRWSGRTQNLRVSKLDARPPDPLRLTLAVEGATATFWLDGEQVLGPVPVHDDLRAGGAGILVWGLKPGTAWAEVLSFEARAASAVSLRR